MQHVSRDVAGRTSRSRNAARRVHAAARPSRIRMESSGTPAEPEKSERERSNVTRPWTRLSLFASTDDPVVVLSPEMRNAPSRAGAARAPPRPGAHDSRARPAQPRRPRPVQGRVHTGLAVDRTNNHHHVIYS